MEQDQDKLREMPLPFKHRDTGVRSLAPASVRHVPVKEAKAKLTELLRAVEAGETVVLTRHGKPIADLVPHIAAKPMSVLERAAAWHKANPGPNIGWVSPDFDDPLPEDFLLQPLPDDFDEKLAEHDRRVAEAWRKFRDEQDPEAAGDNA